MKQSKSENGGKRENFNWKGEITDNSSKAFSVCFLQVKKDKSGYLDVCHRNVMQSSPQSRKDIVRAKRKQAIE